MIRVSRKFIAAVKMADRPAYKIAWEARLHPAYLSRLIHGYDRIYPHDRRIIRVGKILGLKPDECFEEEPNEGKPFPGMEVTHG